MSHLPSDAINQYTDAQTVSDQQAVGRSRAQGKRRHEESTSSEHASDHVSEDHHASDSTWASTQHQTGVHSHPIRDIYGGDRWSADSTMDIHDRTKRQRYLTHDETNMENFGPQPRSDADSRSRAYSAPVHSTIGTSIETSSSQQFTSYPVSVHVAVGDGEGSESVRETTHENSPYTMINSLLRQLHYDRQSQRHPPDPS